MSSRDHFLVSAKKGSKLEPYKLSLYMDFKIRIFKYLGGLKLIIVLLLKSIDTLFSILSIALIYPVTNYLQNREEFYKQINSLNLFKNFNLDSVIIFLFITFSYIIIRILYGQFSFLFSQNLLLI